MARLGILYPATGPRGRGDGAAEELTGALGVPASSTSLGLVAALDHLGVRAAVLDELAGGLGTPVLTANQVTFWHALRLAGQPPPATGLGVLSARKGR